MGYIEHILYTRKCTPALYTYYPNEDFQKNVISKALLPHRNTPFNNDIWTKTPL